MLLFQSQCVIEFLRFAPIPLSSSRSVRTKRDTTIRIEDIFQPMIVPYVGHTGDFNQSDSKKIRRAFWGNWGDILVRWDHCLAISEDISFSVWNWHWAHFLKPLSRFAVKSIHPKNPCGSRLFLMVLFSNFQTSSPLWSINQSIKKSSKETHEQIGKNRPLPQGL